VARALKEKLTCSIEKCKQFSGFLKTVRQAIAVGVVISPPEHAQKKRNNDDEICVIDDMRWKGPRRRVKKQGARECCRWPHKTHRTPRAPPQHAHRHTHTAKCKRRRPSPPAGPMGLFGTSLGIRDVLLALGTCFDTWDFIFILNVNTIF
jgi:hypothetical protein